MSAADALARLGLRDLGFRALDFELSLGFGVQGR